MTLLKGFDVNRDCGGAIHRIVEAKVAFAAATHPHSPRRTERRRKRSCCRWAGIKLVTVWEAGRLVADVVLSRRTKKSDDGTALTTKPVAVGQPASTPSTSLRYDFDADEGQVAAAIDARSPRPEARFRVVV